MLLLPSAALLPLPLLLLLLRCLRCHAAMPRATLYGLP